VSSDADVLKAHAADGASVAHVDGDRADAVVVMMSQSLKSALLMFAPRLVRDADGVCAVVQTTQFFTVMFLLSCAGGGDVVLMQISSSVVAQEPKSFTTISWLLTMLMPSLFSPDG